MKSLAVLDHLVRKVLRREPSPPSYGFIRSAQYHDDRAAAGVEAYKVSVTLHDIYCVARNASDYDEAFESHHVWAFPLWMYTALPMLMDKQGMLQARTNGQEGLGKFFDMGAVLDSNTLAPYLRRIG